jgi:hypothetical protein
MAIWWLVCSTLDEVQLVNIMKPNFDLQTCTAITFFWLKFVKLWHLPMKQDSLFVLFWGYQWDPPNWDASDHVLAVFEKLWMRRGAWAWFHDVWTCGPKVLEYWMISSLKIKLNCSWKFWGNCNVPLVLLEKSWWPGFDGIYLIRFEFRMLEILICKWFLRLKIQINSKKPGFGRKNDLRTW